MVGCAKITINFKISASNSVCYLHDSLKKRLQNQPSTYRNNAIFSKTLSTLSTWSTRTYLREVSPYGRLKECPLGRIVQSEVESLSRGSTVSFVGLFLTELKSLRAVCYWVYFEAIIFLRLSVSLCSLRSTLTEGIKCRRHSCQNGNRSLASMSLRGQDWVLDMTLAFCSLAKTLDAQRVSFQLQWVIRVEILQCKMPLLSVLYKFPPSASPKQCWFFYLWDCTATMQHCTRGQMQMQHCTP